MGPLYVLCIFLLVMAASAFVVPYLLRDKKDKPALSELVDLVRQMDNEVNKIYDECEKLRARVQELEARLAKADEVIKSANGDVVLGSPSQKLIEEYLYGEAEWVFSEQGEK